MKLIFPVIALAGAMLLAGCGSDKPYSGGPPDQPPNQPTVAPSIASDVPSAPSAPDPLLGEKSQTLPDPLAVSDPLAASDPLLGGGKQSTSASQAGRDPLLQHTKRFPHPQWLRGRMRNARVTVQLNGIYYRSFSGFLDQDISKRLRPGSNLVTFLYTPQSIGSSADLEIVEGDHNPPIAPLVTFHTTAQDLENSDLHSNELKPLTKTFRFVAN